MFTYKSLLMKSKPMLALWAKPARFTIVASRAFSDTSKEMNIINEQEEGVTNISDEERVIQEARKFGADLSFNSKKHGYILSFPWNFDEVIKDYEQDFRPLKSDNFWYKWIHNREIITDFNELFRVFHQSCALNDNEGIDRVCEPKLAQYMKRCLYNVHYHGMDIEMANLTVHQPKIDILNVELHNGLSVDRSRNEPREAYNISDTTLMGAPVKVYTSKANDTRSILDHLDYNYKPYLVSVTTLIHSPMKLFVYNQNRSEILFGSSDEEQVKNVVKFEINVRWLEFLRLLPVRNKPLLSRQWKITDYNNVLNENPYFSTEH